MILSSADGRAACRICGGVTVAAFTTRDFNRHLSDNDYRYLRCHDCGTLALAEVPADLGAFYTNDYYRLPSNREGLRASAGPAEQEKLELIRGFAPDGRLLEVGPAAGAFLAVAQDAGYDVHAIEMDEDCCRFIERELHVPTVRSGDPATALDGTGPFEVVVLWHVIEHVLNPPAVLAAIARVLAPGGVLALAAPNPESLELRVLGGRWAHIDAPRHVFLMPLDMTARIAGEQGLETVYATTNGPAAIAYTRCGWCESLGNIARGDHAHEVLRRAGGAAVRALGPIERRGRRGATYTLILRRPPTD